MSHAVGIFLCASQVTGLGQGTVDEAILGIHDGGLRVVARLFLHTQRSTQAGLLNMVEGGGQKVMRHQLLHVAIAL